jgi:hypothetical protein
MKPYCLDLAEAPYNDSTIASDHFRFEQQIDLDR